MCLNCGKVVHGAVALTKVGMQMVGVPIDQAPADCIAARRDACRNCEQSSKDPAYAHRPSKGLTASSTCRLCGCNIKAKTRLQSEQCPANKWPDRCPERTNGITPP